MTPIEHSTIEYGGCPSHACRQHDVAPAVQMRPALSSPLQLRWASLSAPCATTRRLVVSWACRCGFGQELLRRLAGAISYCARGYPSLLALAVLLRRLT